MSERFTVTRIDEVGGYADDGRPRWHMLRSTLGVRSFGINAWTATEHGQEVIGTHDELGQGAGGHEELYLVVAGRARFTLDGETVEAPAGTVVYVPDPSVRRGATADRGTTVLVVGGKPGAAFAESPWERSAEALRHWTTGDWDAAIAVLERLHRETPSDAGVLYNLACAEARAGRGEEALGHLRRAVSLESRFLEYAAGDDDLASLRDDPAFPRA